MNGDSYLIRAIHSSLQSSSADVRFHNLGTEGKNAEQMSCSEVGFISCSESDEWASYDWKNAIPRLVAQLPLMSPQQFPPLDDPSVVTHT